MDTKLNQAISYLKLYFIYNSYNSGEINFKSISKLFENKNREVFFCSDLNTVILPHLRSTKNAENMKPNTLLI